MSRTARLPWCLAVAAVNLCLGSTAAIAAAAARDAATVADEYVAIALDSNLALQGQRIEVERATAALAAARARFLPEVSLEARYTRAEGGREIEFPVGALLNPAYQTLNELLVAQGQPPRFTSLPDVNIPFQREREQDTRVSLRQPLYAPAIPAAAEAQRELLRGAGAGEQALARRLQRDVYLGYLDWLKALRAQTLLQATAEVLDENHRVVESLLRNGRVTEDQLLRARVEQLAVAQQLLESRQQIDQARSYVNFLLNRPLVTPLEDAREPLPDNSATASGTGTRPELLEADAMGAAAAARHRAARAAMQPSVSLGIDAGTQGTSWQFGPGHNYVAASLVFSWKFFDGGARRAEADQARLATRRARLQQENLQQQIGLEVQEAEDRLAASHEALAVASARAEAATAALRIAERKRDAGAISQAEFLDARSAATTAGLALNVTRFEQLQRRIELQYATGATPAGIADPLDTPP